MSDRPLSTRKRAPAGLPFNGSGSVADPDTSSNEKTDDRARGGDRWSGAVGNYEPGFGLPDQKVLGELSHALGNYFHKIYYWLEYLRNHGADAAENEVPLRMLDDTVERLEGFSRMALEYFAPAELRFTKLTLGEVFAATTPWLGGRHMHVEGAEGWREVIVFADPSRLDHILRAVLGRLNKTLVREDEFRVEFSESRRDEFDGIEIRFSVGEGAESLAALTEGIEMSVAEKYLKIHGGELFTREENGTRILGMFLPLYR